MIKQLRRGESKTWRIVQLFENFSNTFNKPFRSGYPSPGCNLFQVSKSWGTFYSTPGIGVGEL
jgi:hypothetical protein